MSGTSDIPDWCYIQAGVKYDPTLPPASEDYNELLSHSPMSACDKVCTYNVPLTVPKHLVGSRLDFGYRHHASGTVNMFLLVPSLAPG